VPHINSREPCYVAEVSDGPPDLYLWCLLDPDRRSPDTQFWVKPMLRIYIECGPRSHPLPNTWSNVWYCIVSLVWRPVSHVSSYKQGQAVQIRVCLGTDIYQNLIKLTSLGFKNLVSFNCTSMIQESRGGAVGSGTALQAGRSRVRFPMLSLESFLPAVLWPWGWLSL